MKKIIWLVMVLLCLSLASGLDLEVIDKENKLNSSTVQKINNLVIQSKIPGKIILQATSKIDPDEISQIYYQREGPFVYILYYETVALFSPKDFPQVKREKFNVNDFIIGQDQNKLFDLVKKTINLLEGKEIEFKEEKPKEIPIRENKKNPQAYTDKTVFLISDENWKDILRLMPATIWNKNRESCQDIYDPKQEIKNHKCAYPLLIYHREGDAFDIDSTVIFLEHYQAEKIVVVGTPPKGLVNVLGAKVSSVKSISSIDPQDHIRFWKSFKQVVISEDDYKTAMMASVYASHLNAPLFIQDNNLSLEDLKGRELICIGNIKGLACKKSFTLAALQKEYIKLTGSNKVIIVNPNDINEEFCAKLDFVPEHSTLIKKGNCKDSLAAPYLAAAKDEFIIFADSKEPGPDANDFTHTIKDIDVDSDDNLYAIDINNNRIVKFDQNGKLVSSFGSQGTADGQFKFPRKIHIDKEDNIYVADSGNYRIQKFDKNHNFLMKFGFEKGFFSTIGNIGVDSKGNIYVLALDNKGRSSIEIFDKNGKKVWHRIEEGIENMRFKGLEIDSKDNLLISSIPIPPPGALFINGYNPPGLLIKIDNKGNLISKWGSEDFRSDGDRVASDIILNIDLDSEDNLYISFYQTGIKKFTPDLKRIINQSNSYIIAYLLAVDSKKETYIGGGGEIKKLDRDLNEKDFKISSRDSTSSFEKSIHNIIFNQIVPMVRSSLENLEINPDYYTFIASPPAMPISRNPGGTTIRYSNDRIIAEKEKKFDVSAIRLPVGVYTRQGIRHLPTNVKVSDKEPLKIPEDLGLVGISLDKNIVGLEEDFTVRVTIKNIGNKTRPLQESIRFYSGKKGLNIRSEETNHNNPLKPGDEIVYKITYYLSEERDPTDFDVFEESLEELNIKEITEMYPFGRIFGVTVSGTSSYIARSVFFSQLPKFMSSINVGHSFQATNAPHPGIKKSLSKRGYDALCYMGHKKTKYDPLNVCEHKKRPETEKFEKKGLIIFDDHGYPSGWAGTLESGDIKDVSSSVVIAAACLTLDYYSSDGKSLMGLRFLEKGAAGYYGSLSITYLSHFVPSFFRQIVLGENLGTTLASMPDLFLGSTPVKRTYILLGDPTLNPNIDAFKIPEFVFEYWEVKRKVNPSPSPRSYDIFHEDVLTNYSFFFKDEIKSARLLVYDASGSEIKIIHDLNAICTKKDEESECAFEFKLPFSYQGYYTYLEAENKEGYVISYMTTISVKRIYPLQELHKKALEKKREKKYQEAIDLLLEEAAKSPVSRAGFAKYNAYNDIAIIYQFDLKDYKKAIEFYKKTKAGYEDYPHPPSETNLYFLDVEGIGDCYLGLKEYDNAIEVFNQFYENVSKDPERKAEMLFRIASVYLLKNDFDNAIAKYEEIINLPFKSSMMIVYMSFVYQERALAYEKKGDIKNACKYYTELSKSRYRGKYKTWAIEEGKVTLYRQYDPVFAKNKIKELNCEEVLKSS